MIRPLVFLGAAAFAPSALASPASTVTPEPTPISLMGLTLAGFGCGALRHIMKQQMERAIADA